MFKANLIIYSLLLFFTCSAYAGDGKKGQALYTTCVACHGDKGQGNKALNAPRLAGQEEWYIIRQLKNFKLGIRGTNPKDTFGAQMRPMAMILSDDKAIDDVASYIVTFPTGPAKK